MIRLHLVSPAGVTPTVLARLDGEAGATNLTVAYGAALEPPGDVITADVARERADAVVSDLTALGLDEHGSVSFTNLEAISSARARAAKHAARGHGLDALVWHDLEGDARADAGPSVTYFVLMALAAVIAAVGIIVDSSVLIIGAMIVGPEYGPLSACAVGLFRRRLFAGLAAVTLGAGLIVAILGAAAITALFLAVGEVSGGFEPAGRFLTRFVSEPNGYSVVVALAAGAAGTIALAQGRQAMLAGVLVSVTTIPAAAAIGTDLVLGDFVDALGAFAQLTINLVCIMVASLLTLLAHDRLARRWHRG